MVEYGFNMRKNTMSDIYVRVEPFENGTNEDKGKVVVLDTNKFYKVENIISGEGATLLILSGVEGDVSFNAVNFEFYLEDEEDSEKYIHYNIFADPAYNPYFFTGDNNEA